MLKGLSNLSNIGSVLKQAQEFGSKLDKLKNELRDKRAQGTAGAGLVTVEVNGWCEVVRCKIDPSLIKPDDREMLEDLIVAAVNQASAKAKDLYADALKSASAGGSGLPGLKELVSQMGGGDAS